MNTLLLNPTTWNLEVDSNRNIAVAADPYALAQSVSNAVRVFSNELYFDMDYGIQYTTEILGKTPPLPLIKKRYEDLAMTVTGVTKALCTITGINNRVCNGILLITDVNNITFPVVF